MDLQYRNTMLEMGVIDVLIYWILNTQSQILLEYTTNCIAVLCYKGSLYKYVFPALQPMLNIIRSNCVTNKISFDTLTLNALWAMSYIFRSYCDSDKSMDVEIISELLLWCEHNSDDIRILIPLVGSIGDIVACESNDENTHNIITCGGLRIFNTLLDIKNICVSEYICWTISNILCDTNGQLLVFMKETELVHKIVQLISPTNSIKLQLEALYVLKNIVTHGNTLRYTIPKYIYIDRVIGYGAIHNIFDIIRDNNEHTIYLAFEVLICLVSNILMNHEYIPIIEKIDGIQHLTKCLSSPNNIISLRARTVLVKINMIEINE